MNIRCLFVGVLLLIPLCGMGQEVSKEDVLSTICRVADHVIQQTTYRYYDQANGVQIDDLSRYGYNKYVVPQNGYNDWKYWKEYFEKRKTYKMLQSLNGRKSLLYMWEKQNHVCPICGEPINKEHSWGTNERIVNGKKVNFLVHDSCRRKVIQLNKCNNELVSNE